MDTEGNTVGLESIGTVVIGPNALLREGLGHVLPGADFRILASAAYIDGSIATLLPPHQAILLIIEASSDFEATRNQIKTFKENCPEGRVVVLVHQLQLPEMVLAFSAGANAYLVSVSTTGVFIKTLELVMLGETILPPTLLKLLYNNESTSNDGDEKLNFSPDKQEQEDYGKNRKADLPDDGSDTDSDGDADGIDEALPKIGDNLGPRLSGRQTLILRYLSEGDANKTIARKIHITDATVKAHVKAILRKTGVQNRTQAAMWAMNNGSFIPEGQSHASAVSKLLAPPPQDLVTENLVSEQVPPPAQNGALPSPQDFKIDAGASAQIRRR